MASGDQTSARSRPVLLVGSGSRPKELGAVLAALGTVRARRDGEQALEPHRTMGLADLEELLAQRPAAGTLILDYERVPGEDIGFVRRFLERHAEWRLIVVGEDVSDRRARGLLALPRTQCLPWPPDLEEIAALLQPTGAAPDPSENGSARSSDERDTEKRPRTADERKPGPTRVRTPEPASKSDDEPERPERVPPKAAVERGDTEAFDVGALVEELLAGASLVGGSSPRFLYRCSSSVSLFRDRVSIGETCGALLDLARHCAGEKGVVSVQVDNAPDSGDPEDTARVRIDFPCGPLDPADWPVLFDAPIKVDPSMADVVTRAARAAAALDEMGARVVSTPLQKERLRLELFVASESLAAHQTAAAAPERRAKPRSKAEDPFA